MAPPVDDTFTLHFSGVAFNRAAVSVQLADAGNAATLAEHCPLTPALPVNVAEILAPDAAQSVEPFHSVPVCARVTPGTTGAPVKFPPVEFRVTSQRVDAAF